MRKIYKYIFLSVIIAGLYSCQEVIKPEQPKPSEPKPPYEKPIEEYCYHTKITALSDTEWSLGDVLKIVKIEDNNTINTMITLSSSISSYNGGKNNLAKFSYFEPIVIEDGEEYIASYVSGGNAIVDPEKMTCKLELPTSFIQNGNKDNSSVLENKAIVGLGRSIKDSLPINVKSILSYSSLKLTSPSANEIITSVSIMSKDGKKIFPSAVSIDLRDLEKAPMVNPGDLSSSLLFNIENADNTNQEYELSYITAPNFTSENAVKIVVATSSIDINKKGGVYLIDSNAGEAISYNSLKTSTIAITAANKVVYQEEGNSYVGDGVMIGGVIWAPVNCGYTEKLPYGLLFQWGRKDGQGYGDPVNKVITENGIKFNVDDITSDVKIGTPKADTYYKFWFKFSSPNGTWGGSDGLTKTAADPCPKGWRVPNLAEATVLKNLFIKGQSDYLDKNQTTIKHGNSEGLCGRAFSENGNTIFIPCIGLRMNATTNCLNRDSYGYFWLNNNVVNSGGCLFFGKTITNTNAQPRAWGMGVRCVKE